MYYRLLVLSSTVSYVSSTFCIYFISVDYFGLPFTYYFEYLHVKMLAL